MTDRERRRRLTSGLRRDGLRHAVAGLASSVSFGLLVVLLLGWPWPSLALSAALYCGFLAAASRWLEDHLPHARLGAANRLTLLRAALVVLFAWPAFDPASAAGDGWAMVALALAALLLDGADGACARRFGLQSRFGARFDQELDALFVLLLAATVWRLGKAGGWILLAGVWHYAFHVWLGLRPHLRRELPPSMRRKTVCVIQIAALIISLSPIVVPPLSSALCSVAVALLSASFLIDADGLRRRARLASALERAATSERPHGPPLGSPQ